MIIMMSFILLIIIMWHNKKILYDYLNYKTNNPRWGLSRIEFQSWTRYSFILGYLSNPEHYRNLNQNSLRANVSVHIERNDRQGA